MFYTNHHPWNLRHARFIIDRETEYYPSCQGFEDPRLNSEDILLDSDIPEQVKLDRNTDLCGYISPEGEYYKCGHCEHETIVGKLALDLFPEEIENFLWFGDTASKPEGMSDAEYFLMRMKGFVKISSFKESIDEMYLLYYDELTPQQAEIVYPR